MKYSQPPPLGFGGKRFRARMPEAGPLEAMFIKDCVWAISPWRPLGDTVGSGQRGD